MVPCEINVESFPLHECWLGLDLNENALELLPFSPTTLDKFLGVMIQPYCICLSKVACFQLWKFMTNTLPYICPDMSPRLPIGLHDQNENALELFRFFPTISDKLMDLWSNFLWNNLHLPCWTCLSKSGMF